jgi:hypothetical protein
MIYTTRKWLQLLCMDKKPDTKFAADGTTTWRSILYYTTISFLSIINGEVDKTFQGTPWTMYLQAGSTSVNYW